MEYYEAVQSNDRSTMSSKARSSHMVGENRLRSIAQYHSFIKRSIFKDTFIFKCVINILDTVLMEEDGVKGKSHKTREFLHETISPRSKTKWLKYVHQKR